MLRMYLPYVSLGQSRLLGPGKRDCRFSLRTDVRLATYSGKVGYEAPLAAKAEQPPYRQRRLSL